MNTQDFNLLTKEEIDEVVAEVLAEQGLSMQETTEDDPRKRKIARDFQKRQGLKVGSGGFNTPGEQAQADARKSADAQNKTDKQMAGITDQDGDGVIDDLDIPMIGSACNQSISNGYVENNPVVIKYWDLESDLEYL